MERVDLRFKRGSAGIEELKQAIDEVLAEPELASRQDLPDEVQLFEDGQGLDPATVAVVVTLVKLTGHVAADVWDDVIWPRVRRRLDDDALGEREDS
jgi:hypothetical protein